MLTAYPVAMKRKSFDICAALLEGYPGPTQLVTDGKLRGPGAVFYGVDHSNIQAFNQARAAGLEYWYVDNSYFDSTRGTHYRVTKNALQHNGVGASNCKRFRALGLSLAPWRDSGSHVLLCPQSDSFMREIAGVAFDWTEKTVEALHNFTTRELRVREWNRDKAKLSRSLPADLEGAHALVTWSSAAAVTAVISGVPVVCTGPSAVQPMSGDLADIESLPHPDREQWLGVLADAQYTIEEMRDGFPWNKSIPC